MVQVTLAVKILASLIVTVTVVALVLLLIILPLLAPHNLETVEWLNQAEYNELKEWISSKKGTLEKYQSTAQGIYDFKNCA